MSVLILDPEMSQEIREERETRKIDRWDEVWEGVHVVAGVPNNEHQRLLSRLTIPFMAVIEWEAGDQFQPGANVSDRQRGWKQNYRIPDALVFLRGNPASDCGTHWVGGPDFAVEIVSPGDQPRDKLDFYAKVGTRELLIIDRDPWSLELYQLKKGKLHSTGRSEAPRFATLTSKVLPLSFQLRKASPRPVIHLMHTATGQTWTA
ncbi:MAG TPA: Uma2 family endonuclease [Urbifossiella sp.]|nr:Uma2 family endonuclease [Urbifossiella sp.]